MKMLRICFGLVAVLSAAKALPSPSPAPMDEAGPSSRNAFQPHIAAPQVSPNLGVPAQIELSSPIPQPELLPFAKTDSEQIVHDIEMTRLLHLVLKQIPTYPQDPTMATRLYPVGPLDQRYFQRRGAHFAATKQQLDAQLNIPRFIPMKRTSDGRGIIFAMPVIKTDTMDALVHNIQPDEFVWAIITAFSPRSGKPWLLDSFAILQNVQSDTAWTMLALHHSTMSMNQIIARLN